MCLRIVITLRFLYRLNVNTHQNIDSFRQQTVGDITLKKASYDQLYYGIFNADWSEIGLVKDVNTALDIFYNVLHKILDLSVPKYSPKMSNFPPWLSRSIISNLKLKESYRKKWKKYGNQFYFEEFKRLRVLCKQMINAAYASYLKKIEHELYVSPRDFWKYIQSKKGTSRIPGKISYEGQKF